jgi:CHAD domain-containing protein
LAGDAGATSERAPKPPVTDVQVPTPPSTSDDLEGLPGRSVAIVVRLALGADVARLLGADPLARLAEGPEGVHQARVATRRLRSHLATYGDVLRPGPTARLSKDLRWLGRALATVRDLDVLRARIASAVKEIDPLARTDGLALLARIDEERVVGDVALQSVLVTARYRGLLEALGRAVADPPLRSGADRPAAPFLHDVIGARYRDLRAGVDALPALPLDAQLHDVRILAKPTRYVAEAGAKLLAAPCSRFAKRVTELCDRLGDLNDGACASQWLDGAAAEPGRAATVARVRTVEIGRMADARSSWALSWSRVRETAGELGWEDAVDDPRP